MYQKDQRKKPEPLVYYGHMKGGIDVVDVLLIGASTRTKIKQWTLNANFFLLDTVRTNARTLYKEVNKKNVQFQVHLATRERVGNTLLGSANPEAYWSSEKYCEQD